ncbi:phytoene desaturase family protein [Shouchella hunanensis]|uniref:4,4'-diaponeurosporene oxygenase n=1 Tax=Shouchella hunanensis TaxID=766894 RepID=A0ABY7W2H0_9BACI|nr:phytoene desaturase family protein [Shouchella hunanensis]WDF03128.1 phytoene desaturase family protein [Shouchella hunanensis]GAF21402.1 phytoene desaturase, neurosporene or lycopene producing [Bacillus sp. JCM 19047]
MKSIAIIGSGLGGLAAAVLLASSGYKVDVFEKHSYPGGKMKRYHIGGARFDFGPNTLTMPDVFKEIFTLSGANPDDYVQFKKLENHTMNYFPDGSTFLSSSDRERMIAQLATFNIGATHYDSYVKSITKLYTHAVKEFFPRTFSSLQEYASFRLLRSISAVKPLTTMHDFHQSFFTDKRIVQMLDRYATYIGSSPYLTPATFAMIGYLEYVDGVYYVPGGNPTIAEAFHKRAQELGVTFHFNEEVTQLQINDQQTITSLSTKKNERLHYDGYLLNGDYLTVYPKLVDKAYRPSFTEDVNVKEPTSSAFVILSATNRKTAAKHYHQVYFSHDYEKEFEDIFSKKSYPLDPTIYISNSSTVDTSAVSNTGGDNLFILVNAPSLTNDNRYVDKEDLKNWVYRLLEKKGVFIKEFVIDDLVITPQQLSEEFHSYFGGLYGYTSHSLSQAFNRPATKGKDIKNLYFTGGSTHPGGGSPMVVQSGRNAANLMKKSLK